MQERLGEMPNFFCQREVPYQWMRDRKGLSELRSPYSSFYLFVENSIHIEVETKQIVTPKNRARLVRRTNIDVWRRP
jgi:hypothetical protein